MKADRVGTVKKRRESESDRYQKEPKPQLAQLLRVGWLRDPERKDMEEIWQIYYYTI